MRIDHCEYAHDCGDGYWFCGHRGFCLHDKCEMPPEPGRKQTFEELRAKINIRKGTAKQEPPAEEKRGRKSKYDWDKVIPILQQMRDAGKTWPEITKATGVPVQSLMNKWKWAGMTIRTGVGE